MKIGTIHYSAFFISFLIIYQCDKLIYKPPTKFPGDTENYPQFKDELPGKNLSQKEKETLQKEILQIKINISPLSYKYDMLIAHCYRKLGQYSKAAEHFNGAAKKTNDKDTKKKMQKNAIISYGYAGLFQELNGNYKEAIGYYEECNRYCKIYGFGAHIPHERIEHLRLKRNKAK